MSLLRQSRIFGHSASQPRAFQRAQYTGWVLCGVALGLLLASRMDTAVLPEARGRVQAMLAPVMSAATAMTEPLGAALSAIPKAWNSWNTAAGNETAQRSLIATAARTAELERENAELRKLTRFSAAPAVLRMTAPVIAASATSLTRTLMIGAGRNQGVRDGMPVLDGAGLAGRISQAFDNTATVLLLSDRLSRIPVSIGQQQARGLLAGTGSGLPRLDFVAGGVAVAAGDLVTTSGVGGVFPRGLPVGAVVADGAGWRVAPVAQDLPPAVMVLQVEIPASDAGEVQNRKTARETAAGTRLKDRVQ